MRDILQTGSVLHPILYRVSKPVESIDASVLDVVKDMEHYLTIGIGIAAVQLGVPIRIIGVRYGNTNLFIVNPSISKHSDKAYQSREGCLSIAHGREQYTVSRFKRVKVKGLDLNGNVITVKGYSDVFGACLQHEIDHLNGILINSTKGGV